MLYVSDLNGNEELLTDYSVPERDRVVNGEYYLSFTLFKTSKNEHSFPMVVEDAAIFLDDDEFRIKQLGEEMIGQAPSKKVSSIHVFFIDMAKIYQHSVLNGTVNMVQALNHVFEGTGWTWVNQGAFTSIRVENWGDKRQLALFQELLNKFEAEFTIDNKNKTVTIRNEIGTDTEAQFRYNHNLKTLKKSIDSKNIFTYIEGYGKDGLKRTYTSPLASDPRYGIIEQDPVKDEKYTDAASLDARLQAELNDKPDVLIESEIVALQKQGLKLNQFDLGDYVYMLHEKMDIDIQIRAARIVDYPLHPMKSPKVTLTNYREALQKKSFTAITANFAFAQKQIQQVMDADGNLTLALKRLYMNTDVYADESGVWYVDPTDPNRFVHIGAGGIDVHRGLIRVEREDGYATIIGGVIQHGFNIQASEPPFQTEGVEKIGQFYRVRTTNRDNIQRYTFKHDSRYLHVVANMKTTNGMLGTIAFDVLDSNDEIILSSTYLIETRWNDDQGYRKEALIDLGVPTGELVAVYWRMYGANDVDYVYGSLRYIVQEG
ncbi:phage tail protein [Bacillus sp. OTU530]|uniref:phage tail protein n=1 Tax=Bacillus sp. OTU530 TaxID=3043862 RepID=UPI00313D8A90